MSCLVCFYPICKCFNIFAIVVWVKTKADESLKQTGPMFWYKISRLTFLTPGLSDYTDTAFYLRARSSCNLIYLVFCYLQMCTIVTIELTSLSHFISPCFLYTYRGSCVKNSRSDSGLFLLLYRTQTICNFRHVSSIYHSPLHHYL